MTIWEIPAQGAIFATIPVNTSFYGILVIWKSKVTDLVIDIIVVT
jgi:hypothetical protein